VKYKVINLVITMNQGSPVLGLIVLLAKEAHHLPKVRQLSDLLAALDVLRGRLRSADGLPSRNLAAIEALRLPKALETDGLRVDTVQLGQCPDGILPHEPPFIGRHAWHSWILDDSAVQEGHDIEGRAYDATILA